MGEEWMDVDRETGRSPLLLIIGGVLLLTALGLIIFGGGFLTREPEVAAPVEATQPTSSNDSGSIPAGSDGGIAVGDTAPDFALANLDGDMVRLSHFAGQPIIVNFWATWCPPCDIEMPELQAAYETYQDDGLVILAVNEQEPAGTVRDYFIDEKQLTFTPLLDRDATVSLVYGIGGLLPTSYFIDRDGTIIAIHRGPLSQEQIAAYLAETLSG